MKSFKEFIVEKAPPGKKAEEWIKSNKAKFKDEYGDDWEEVLYATAWKLFKESINELDVDLGELVESTSASTMTSGIANSDSRPLFKKSTFIGHPCIEVDDATYSSCIRGKQPFKRWKKFIQSDENLRNELKQLYNRNKRVLIKNSKTGGMVYIK